MLWLVAGGAGFVAVLLLAAAVLPMPSTLMLWRLASGQPVTRVWVPLERISPELVRAVIASEDQRYCSHRGIDWGALREVLGDGDVVVAGALGEHRLHDGSLGLHGDGARA